MTLPGLSGSFLIMLMGNYVLLLVDSVNALYDTLTEIFVGDFSFWTNEPRIQLLQVLIVFTLGSIVGLISLSHLLAYILKRYKKATFALILGFIAGSLGVVWPWKEPIYMEEELIIAEYERYFPQELNLDNISAIAMIILGAGVVATLENYGNYLKKKNG